MNCQWCDEPVAEPWDQHPSFKAPMHAECGIRAVCGSAAHIKERCGCYVPGSVETDDPGLTKREAARAAARALFGRKI